MKLCRFNVHHLSKPLANRLGVVHEGRIHDVTPVLDQLPTQRYPLPQHDLFIAALPSLMEPIRQAMQGAPTYAPEAVHYLSPVANPGKIIGAPINYQAHVDESKADAGIAHGRSITGIGDWGLFLKAGSSLVGVSEPIHLRFPERRNDHEVELGVVIGRQARMVRAQDAMQHIAGYTVTLDMTLRGTEFQCFRKSIDSYSVAGPWLVTPDEVPTPGDLAIWLTVNGQERQRSRTSRLIYDIPRLIEFASSFYTLEPGDILMTGTPEGVGPVLPGDELHAGIEGLGEFRMRVAPDYAQPGGRLPATSVH
jgi:2-keto-4-pentenoate hydratase/2-oxohepta-3-ene-1,7-dioic acid hydratase in catechol pathway